MLQMPMASRPSSASIAAFALVLWPGVDSFAIGLISFRSILRPRLPNSLMVPQINLVGALLDARRLTRTVSASRPCGRSAGIYVSDCQ
jgi:hypothetical protein